MLSSRYHYLSIVFNMMTVSNLSFLYMYQSYANSHVVHPHISSADFPLVKTLTQTLTSVAMHRFAYANPEEWWLGWLHLKSHAVVWESETQTVLTSWTCSLKLSWSPKASWASTTEMKATSKYIMGLCRRKQRLFGGLWILLQYASGGAVGNRSSLQLVFSFLCTTITRGGDNTAVCCGQVIHQQRGRDSLAMSSLEHQALVLEQADPPIQQQRTTLSSLNYFPCHILSA